MYNTELSQHNNMLLSNKICTEKLYFVKMTKYRFVSLMPDDSCHIDECIHHFDT
jgi:hypothetical protein